MLTESIKNKITEQYGQQIRYSKDCENLAIHISTKVGANISASTIKRLFGFVKSTSKPNKYTLDIIARYLQTTNWEELTISSQTTITTTIKDKTNRKNTNSIIYYLLAFSFLCVIIFIINFLHNQTHFNNSWKTEAELPEVRKNGKALFYRSNLYYLGGSDAEFIRSNNWKYELSKKTWSHLKDMPEARAEMGCVAIHNRIYCFGGWRGEKLGPSDRADVYSIQTNQWDSLPKLPKAMIAVEAIAFNNSIYILGGTLGETINYFYKFDINTRQYTELPLFKKSRIHFYLQRSFSSIYLFGGNSFKKGEYKIHTSVDAYNIVKNQWQTLKPIPEKVMSNHGVLIGSKIHLFGGKSLIGDKKEGISGMHYSYHLKTHQWKKETSLPFKICDYQILLFNNRFCKLGGTMDFPNPSKKILFKDLN